MKSKKAKDILNLSYHYDSATMTATVTFDVAANAVRAAEQDARKRAMDVYIKSCHYSNKGRAGWCNLYENIHECRPERCARLSEFLKNYDNE